MAVTTMTTKRIKIPPAFKLLSRPSRYKVLYGGRGSGKSWSCAKVALAKGFAEPMRILCAREIQRSINDSVHKLLSKQIEDMGLGGFYDITREAIRGQNGTEFIFKGLRTNPQEIKSMEGIDLCWVEEAQAVSAESWDILIPTIRKPGSEIWITFNPLDEQDPTYQKFVVSPPEDAQVRKVNYNENPYFPEVLRKEMEWLKKRDYESYLHIWEGEVRKLSNALVFAGRFTVEDFETPSGVRFYHGADWGFAEDPTTLIRCFVDNGTLFIDQEAWGVGVEIDQTGALFDTIDTARRWPIKADCARPETISYMRRQGFNISAAKKWQGSIEDGIEYIKTYDIVVHPRCRHTIDELNRYSYKVDKQTGDVLPIIVDKYNHCLDSLRYALDGLIKGRGAMHINSKAISRIGQRRR
jgi:phage terminase large subunit